MQIIEIEQNTPEWLEYRAPRITGSKVKDVVSDKGDSIKKEVFKILAYNLTAHSQEEFADSRDRGHSLEAQGVIELSKFTGLNFTDKKVVWQSDENDNMAISPDTFVEAEVIEVSGEIKCLEPAGHLEAIIDFRKSMKDKVLVYKKTIPAEFKKQAIQYFIVNNDNKKHYTAFYCPEVTCMPLCVFEITREEIEEDIAKYKAQELEILSTVRLITESLVF